MAAETTPDLPARPSAPIYICVTGVHVEGPAVAFRLVAADGQPPTARGRASGHTSPVTMLRLLGADSPIPGTSRYLLRTRNSSYVAFMAPHLARLLEGLLPGPAGDSGGAGADPAGTKRTGQGGGEMSLDPFHHRTDRFVGLQQERALS
jgi:hypothetical protein